MNKLEEKFYNEYELYYKEGRCKKFNEKKEGNENCIHGVE